MAYPQPGYYPQQPGYPPQGYPPQGQPGYPPQPQPYGYAPMQPAPGTVMEEYTMAKMHRKPFFCACYNCSQPGFTQIYHEMGTQAWLLFLFFLIISCGLLCIIPCCFTSCKDVIHTCKGCQTRLGHCSPWCRKKMKHGKMGKHGKKDKKHKKKH